MVSHMAVENEILRISGLSAGDIFVTAIPDDARGERLVVIYCNIDKTPDDIVGELKKSDIPRLWIPNSRDFIKIAALPVLPNGKLNLRRLKQIALEKLSAKAKSV